MTKKTETPTESLLTFPCDFTVKVFGLATDEFESRVCEIIRKHAPDLSDAAIQSRLSENGKYKALSITVHATSKAQMDAMYQDLSSSPLVLTAL